MNLVFNIYFIDDIFNNVIIRLNHSKILNQDFKNMWATNYEGFF